MESIFQLSNLQKQYEGRAIISIDQLDIYRGEIFAIVGPSGSGKSTLLRLLNFLEPYDLGTLVYKGKTIRADTVSLDTRREITTVFQRPALLAASVEANIAYGLNLRGIRDGKAEILKAIERMGLKPLTHTGARKLSGGEAQRVALARAIVLHPEVLLLDEPTANLDPYNIGLMEEVITEINHQQNTTIVLVTHNIFQAKRLAHRIGLLLGGNFVEIAPTKQFFENPRDPRTRAFVNGEMVY
jgi:tungstate transport system ATP-binding protein